MIQNKLSLAMSTHTLHANQNKESGATGLGGWPQDLANDAQLSPGLRESYRRTLRGFLDWCRQTARPVNRQ